MNALAFTLSIVLLNPKFANGNGPGEKIFDECHIRLIIETDLKIIKSPATAA